MKELTVAEWFDEIDRGLEYRRIYAREDNWNILEQTFYNRSPTQTTAGPNLLISTGDSVLSQLTVPYPYVTVKARNSNSLAGAAVQERTDNTLMEDLDICTEVEHMAHCSFLFGKGIGKLGYDSEFGYSKKFDYGQLYKTELGFSMTQVNAKGQRIEFRANPGMPWLKSVLPHDIVVPWGTKDLKTTPWIAHRVVRHVDEVRGDVKYHAQGITATMSMRDFVKSYEAPMRPYRIGQEVYRIGEMKQETEYCELWEIHDRRTRKIYVVAADYKGFLRNEEDVLQINGELPFVELNFNPKARTFWVTSDADYLLNAQLELADIALQGQKHRRARVLKILVEEGLMDEVEMERLLSKDVGAVAKFKQVDGDIRTKVYPVQLQADMGIMQESEFTRRNASVTVGLSSNQAGEFDSSSRRSATEATIVSSAANLRMSRRQTAMATLYKNIFGKLNPIIWEFWKAKQVVEILGPDGKQMWKEVTGDDIKGEYRYEVGFTINPPEGLAQRRQNTLNLYMLLRQDPLIDPVQLRRYLSFSFNDPGFTSIFKQGVLDGQGVQAPPTAFSQPGQNLAGNVTGSADLGG